MRPGWKTTEFWLSLLTQVLALFTVLGFITGAEAKTLEDALSKCIAAVFLFAANAYIVVSYIKGRVALKLPDYEVVPYIEDELPEPAPAPDKPHDPFLPPTTMVLLALVSLLFFAAAPAFADDAVPTGLFNNGWRKQTEKRLDDHNRLIAEMMQGQRQQQHNPQIIVLPPALQQLPIQGQPHQQLPIPGQPYQQLPIPGQPLQPLPIPGQPLQPLPVPGQPLQPLPIQGPQQQALPQSYSQAVWALARPRE